MKNDCERIVNFILSFAECRKCSDMICVIAFVVLTHV